MSSGITWRIAILVDEEFLARVSGKQHHLLIVCHYARLEPLIKTTIEIWSNRRNLKMACGRSRPLATRYR